MTKPPTPIDRGVVRRASARAARDYERHDALQREIEARLLDSLGYYEAPPARVLDVGCGTGRGAAALRKRWPQATVIALDLSTAMLRAARHHAGWRRPFVLACADALSLPFPDHSIDVVYSNFCMPWCGAPRPFIKELNRVLSHGGFLVASSLGPDTLTELREAWAAADPERPHVDAFIDMHDIGDATLAAGLKDPVLDTDRITLAYADARAALLDLRGAGVANADPARTRGLTGKARFRAMVAALEARRCNGRIPLTFEVVTIHGWGPPKGFLPRFGSRETPFEVIQWAERPARRR